LHLLLSSQLLSKDIASVLRAQTGDDIASVLRAQTGDNQIGQAGDNAAIRV